MSCITYSFRYASILLVILSCLRGSPYSEDSKKHKINPIPYPMCNMHLDKGVIITIGFGMNKPRKGFFSDKSLYHMDHNLFQWRGESSFFYKPWFSGGASAQILAGEPSKVATAVENRYTVFGRLHQRFGTFSAYAGPFFGLYNLEFSVDSSDALPEPERNKGLAIHDMRQALVDYGVSFGCGWRLSPYFSLIGGGRAEHVVSSEFSLHYYAGLSMDVMRSWSGLEGLTKGFFIGLEWQFETAFDWENPRRKNSQSLSLNTGVGF